MTNPLDGNGVCKRCRGSGDINPVATCPDCDGTGRSPAPSQTAVEPVAGELAMLVNWLPKLIAALGSKPEHVDDVARLARVHALIPTLTAQAAALVAAEAERDQARADYEAATQSHLDHVLDLDIAMNGDGAAKRPLLIDIKLWLLEFIARAEAAESEVATLKARIAELEADDHQPSEQQEWRDYDADC